jgi:hypothetical protein
MKINRRYVATISLSVLSVGMLIGYQNCARQIQLEKQVSESVDKITDTNTRLEDLTLILNGMIREEVAARMAADQDLDKKINNLSLELSGYQSLMGEAIKDISSQVAALSGGISDAKSQLNTRITDVSNATMMVESNLNTKILNSEQSLKSLLSSNSQMLQWQISSNLNQILSLENQSTEQKKQIANQGQSIIDLAAYQNEYVAYASQTFATKSDLEHVNKLYNELSYVTKNLDLKIDHTKEFIIETLGEDIHDLTSKLSLVELKVASQDKTIDTIRNDLESAIVDYHSQIQAMSESFRGDLAKTELKIGLLIDEKDEALRTEMFDKLQMESLKIKLYTKKAISLLSTSITSLESKVNAIQDKSDSEKQELLNQISGLKSEMTKAIELEQIERNKIALDVGNLSTKLKRIEDDVKELKTLSEQSLNMISKATVAFEEEKVKTAQRFKVQSDEVSQKISALENSLEKKIQEVAEKSEQLVENLGADVQKNFKSVTADIAILNSKQTNLEHNLKNFIEEYQSDKAKLVQFETNMATPRALIQNHLANVIEALSNLQLRFVQVLNPDENNKDFYDEDFKIKMPAKCNQADEASFANALGMDSFQILSIEYTRLLLTGLRSGNENDRIFFNYGSIEDAERFSRSIALGLIKNSTGAENFECVQAMQKWARGIFLEDVRFKEISARLASDDELERKIDVLYAAFENIKNPAKQIEELIKKAVIGINDGGKAYSLIVAQSVMDIIDGAWNQRLLSDRLATLDNFENLQTKQTQLEQQMQAGFQDLRRLLNDFQNTTNTRLANLESEQGKMSVSLKRALDVLISLSDRAGHQDLKAYVIWAGQPLNYTPQIYPNWKPEVSIVQHFFSGPNSLRNKSDACTGAKILTSAGVRSAYAFGGWGPCWVNFRGLPLTKWGAESQSIWLRIFGAGHIVRVFVDPTKQKEFHPLFSRYNYNRYFDFRNIAPNDPFLKLNGVFSKAVFDIKMPDLLAYYVANIRTWGGLTVSIETIKEDIIGSETVSTKSPTVNYTIQLFSPLILDFHRTSLPQTISATESGVKVDLVGEGKERLSGWVGGHEAAFLVRKIKQGNHKVTANDLFGEGTRIGHKKAKNGFEALRFYDSNKDMVIDAKDSIWNELGAFFDYNQNGKMEDGELEQISSLGIGSINLNYETIAPEKALKDGNDLRYMSKAFDSNNQVKAHVYDVFFGVQ